MIHSGEVGALGVVLDPDWETGPCVELIMGALGDALDSGFAGKLCVFTRTRTASSRARLALGISARVPGLPRRGPGAPAGASLSRESIALHPWGAVTCLEYAIGAAAGRELVESLGMLSSEHLALACVLAAQSDRSSGAFALVRPPDVAAPIGRFAEFSFDLEEAS